MPGKLEKRKTRGDNIEMEKTNINQLKDVKKREQKGELGKEKRKKKMKKKLRGHYLYCEEGKEKEEEEQEDN